MPHYDFTITGQLDGREVSVRWNDGEISGDELAITKLLEMAERAEGREVGIPEWWTTVTDHLTSPVSTIVFLERLFNRKVTFTGNIPLAPPRAGE